MVIKTAERIGPGRPRNDQLEERILLAALDLVVERGYENVTMDAVAARCQAGKATLYRRWSSKAEMVVAAVTRRDYTTNFADTGSLRGDLLAFVDEVSEDMRYGDGGLIAGLVNAMRTDDELAGHLHEHLMKSCRNAARAWTQRCVERGLLRPDADLNLVNELTPALISFRTLVTGEPVDRDFHVRLVDTILLPLLQGLAPTATPERNTHDGPRSAAAAHRRGAIGP